MSGFLAGMVVGMALMVFFVAANMSGGSLDECRAAHPGFDCDFGWIVGEAFK